MEALAQQTYRSPWELGGVELGHFGEELCARHLEDERGFEVIERNWHCPFGEADLIAIDGDVVALIEVKTRLVAESDDTWPELAVDNQKRERYSRIAMAYLAATSRPTKLRFDVAGVRIVSEHKAQLRYIENVLLGDA